MKLMYNLIDSAKCTDDNLTKLAVNEPYNLYLCRCGAIVFVSYLNHNEPNIFLFYNRTAIYDFKELDECWLIGDY